MAAVLCLRSIQELGFPAAGNNQILQCCIAICQMYPYL